MGSYFWDQYENFMKHPTVPSALVQGWECSVENHALPCDYVVMLVSLSRRFLLPVCGALSLLLSLWPDLQQQVSVDVLVLEFS
ncbi:hypothetical protein BaRGS_00025338 [Batillaria attramentaria]|uniref:Uncharacterized protein n=1 Tax=Batillaria attramentaria TaxID=370345 RepID=A0ABD0K8K1_9CAEN